MYATFLSHSYNILEARDGSRALDFFVTTHRRSSSPICRCRGSDGFELVAQMRARPSSSHVPVICLSGFDGTAHESAPVRSASIACSSKPCLPDELARAADEILRQRRGLS